jgi:hypothetical protein
MRATTIVGWLFVLTMPIAASAQEADAGSGAAGQAAQPPGTQGPMTLERVHNGFALAPDFKVTKIDGATGRLAGGYGGWIFDDALLIGAGGYWLTNNTNTTRDFGYGGAVVEWMQRTDHAIGYAARGLVGIGTARFSDTTFIGPPIERIVDRDGRRQIVDRDAFIRFERRTEFFVAEPQASVLFTLTRHMRVDAGVGYRLVAGGRGADDRLRGVTGSVSLQLGALSSRHD